MAQPALLIAGTHSGVGKTAISIAPMIALRRCGFRVPLKAGPDLFSIGVRTARGFYVRCRSHF